MQNRTKPVADTPPRDIDQAFIGGGAEIRPSKRETIDWHYYLLAVRRRLVPALAVFVLAIAVGAYYGSKRVPLYEAKVRLLLEREPAYYEGLADPVAATEQLSPQTQLRTLESSRSLARRTLVKLGRLTPTADTVKDESETSRPTPQIISDPTEIAAIDGFLASIKVVLVPYSRLVDVFVIGPDPMEAARTVNVFTQEFVEQNLDYRTLAGREVLSFLQKRLDEQRRKLDTSMRALQDYREKNRILSRPQIDVLVSQKVNDMVGALTKARTDRIEKEVLYRQLQAMQGDRAALLSVPRVAADPAVVQLSSELVTRQKEYTRLASILGARHPNLLTAADDLAEISGRIDDAILKVVDQVRQEMVAAQAAEPRLAQAVDAQKTETLAESREDVGFAVLDKDVESNQRIFDELNARINETTVTLQRGSLPVTIVDVAEVPQVSIGPSKWTDIKYGAVGGAALAFILIFGLELIDNRIKTASQIKALGLPSLGIVPLEPHEGKKRPLAGRGTSAAFDEAFRSLRTNVRLTGTTEGTRVILVTSAAAGEGKSLVSAGLASTFAMGEDRVVLVDADLRRSSAQTTFDVPASPGLTEVLAGLKELDSGLREFGSLDVLVAGDHPPNPSELLGSRRFTNLLERLRGRYDWVIVDSPPVLAVADTLAMATLGLDVIVVASAEKTPLPALRTAIEHLEETPSRVLGVVLNRADLKRRGYYYSEYYSRDSAKYYVSSSKS